MYRLAGAFSHALMTLDIDVCFNQETLIQELSSVIRLTSPPSPSLKFHLRLSGDPRATASGVAGFGVVVSRRAEAALIFWIPVDNQLCALRLRGSCEVNNRRFDGSNLFVVSVYVPIDYSPEAVKDTLYQKPYYHLRTARPGNNMILAGGMNARVDQLYLN